MPITPQARLAALASPRIGKRGKSKTTLAKEERRAIFDAEASKLWLKTIKKLRPEYLADQFMGKAPEEHNVNGTLVIQIAKEIAEKNNVPTQDPS